MTEESAKETTEETINEIKWTLHDTHPEMVENVRARLSEVIDPEIGLSIIALGLVRDVSIDESGIGHLKMILTTPFCPYGPAMIEMTKAKAVEGMNMPVNIEMGMETLENKGFTMLTERDLLDMEDL